MPGDALVTTEPTLACAEPDLRTIGLDLNHWMPVERASAVKPESAAAARLAGAAIVLVRGRSGEVFALEDRCAHRQVPLHTGVVKGERLQCSYHCWTYDRTGRCVSVPYLDEARTRPNGVRAYPAREAYGFVWVFGGDPERAAETPLPDIPEYHDPDYRLRVLDRRIACHYSFMHENLMDMNHQFLHRRLMGKIRPRLIETRVGEGFVEARYSFARLSGRQSVGEKIIVGKAKSGPQDNDRNLMRICTAYPYQWLTFELAGQDKPALRLWNFYTPQDAEQRSNRTLGLMLIRKPRKLPPGALTLLWPLVIWFTENIFAEDQAIVEQEQAAHDSQGADWNQEINPPILALRDLLRRAGAPLPARSHPLPRA